MSKKEIAKNGTEKLSLATKLFFGAGDIYGGGVFNIVNFFYAIFLTDIVGLDPRLAAPVFLVGKIWDAITDPWMGAITDRTKTKWGRRRPYFLFGAPFVFISFVLLWIPVQFGSQVSKFLYVLFAYIFLNTVTTLIMVPYQAFAGEITLDYHERTSVNSIRLFFSLLSSLFCAVLPMIIVRASSDVRKGYIDMAVIFGMLFALPWLGVFAFTREREFKNVPQKMSIKTLFEPFKIKSFRYLLFIFLGSYLAIDVVSVIFAYFMKWYVGKEAWLPFVLGTLLISEIIFLPVYAIIARKFSKKVSWLIGFLIWTIGAMLIFFIVKPQPSLFLLLAFAAVVGSGVSAVAVMPHAMFGDVTDVGELLFKERREGAFSGLITFVRKIASAVIQAVILFILGSVGYDSKLEQQAPNVILTIRLIVSFAPLIILSISAYFAYKFPIVPSIHKKLVGYLENRRQGKTDTQLESELSKELI